MGISNKIRKLFFFHKENKKIKSAQILTVSILLFGIIGLSIHIAYTFGYSEGKIDEEIKQKHEWSDEMITREEVGYYLGRRTVLTWGDGCTFFTEIKEVDSESDQHRYTYFIYHASPYCPVISSSLYKNYRHTDYEIQWRQTKFCENCMLYSNLKTKCQIWLFEDAEYLEYCKNEYKEYNRFISVSSTIYPDSYLRLIPSHNKIYIQSYE